MISAVVLAAVGASPNGSSDTSPSQPSKPALQSVLENAVQSNLDEVICVVRGLALLRPQMAVIDEKLFWLIDYGADRGKSHSMIAGLWTVHPQSSGVLFLAEDEAVVPQPLIDALIGEFNGSSAWIVAPHVAGKARKPLLFRRELFPEILKLTGEREGLELIEKYRTHTSLIEWRGEAAPAPRRQTRSLHNVH